MVSKNYLSSLCFKIIGTMQGMHVVFDYFGSLALQLELLAALLHLWAWTNHMETPYC